MIRNLKILMLAAMAVAAFGAFGASGAQAAEFHCGVGSGESCWASLEKDGVAKTAHHVFEITNKNGEATTITCNEISGHATSSTRTTPSLTFTVIKYSVCTWNGDPNASVTMNGCGYKVLSNGEAEIVNCGGNEIELKMATCTAAIGVQKTKGITYHNIGAAPNRTVTAEVKVTVNVTGLAGTNCGMKLEGPYIGHYTTGNTIGKAENDNGLPLKEVDGWWE